MKFLKKLQPLFFTLNDFVLGSVHTPKGQTLDIKEIEYDKIDKIRGMDIIFVTTAETDEEAKALLELLGMPFSK